jgi:hypothetical protein
MGSHQVDHGPVIGREGLMRLVGVVERLRARGQAKDVSSWTTMGMAAAPDDGAAAGPAVGWPAGGQPAGGGALAGGDRRQGDRGDGGSGR